MRVGEALDHIGPALQDVTVLVADSGLDLDNPDIVPRLYSLPQDTPAPDADNPDNPPNTVMAGAAGWDLIGGNDSVPNPFVLSPDADPSDENGHGTNAAGLLGAAWNNGQGGAGVAPNARFLALRTCWEQPYPDQCYQYVETAAFNWAADRGVRVVSMSWLADSDPANQEDGFKNAISSHPNVLFVAIPSGNDGAYDVDDPVQQHANTGSSYPPFPCSLNAPNVLCVTTSSPTDGLDCGAYGATSVDVAVPTQNSVTTTRTGGFTGPTGCATSWAAPTAAGIATILFGIDPTASASDVRQAIVDSARKVLAFDGKTVSGGVVDAVAAVDVFQSRRGIQGRVPGGSDGGSQTPGGGSSSPSGSSGSGPAPAAPDATPPTLRLTVSPRSIRRSGRVRVRITISEDAFVRVTMKISGKRTRGALVHADLTAGTHFVVLSGRFRGKPRPMARGRYTLTGVATDAAGNRSQPRTATFRVR